MSILIFVPFTFYIKPMSSYGDSRSTLGRDARLEAVRGWPCDQRCVLSERGLGAAFDEAERFRAVHYRQAVDAAKQARVELTGGDPHANLFG